MKAMTDTVEVSEALRKETEKQTVRINLLLRQGTRALHRGDTVRLRVLLVMTGLIWLPGCTPGESPSKAEPYLSASKTELYLPASNHPEQTPPAGQPTAAAKQEATPVLTKPDLEVTDFKSAAGSDGFVSYVTGVIRNNTDHSYSYARVEIDVYDNYGNQTNSMTVACNGLAAHSQCKFKGSILEPNTSRVEVKDVTGY
jgi:hypothetical protein